MKDIRIERLSLDNFKCHAHLVLDFGGKDAAIYGDNATGKTSVYDALTWLLFGRDSLGNGEKNMEIKPLSKDGEVKDHNAQTAVEAVLTVGGETVTLRRTYAEVWTTKRGSSEPTYDGNTSDYYVDGVPVKKFAFAERVSELVDEDTFKLLTSVSYFADGISWQERRAVLFRIVGVLNDTQIMATDERFASLIEGTGRLSIDDYKKKLLAEKRGLVGTKTEIPARISECQKTLEDIEGLDFEGARALVSTLNTRKNSIEAQLLSLEHDSAAEQKRLDIRAADVELRELENENRAYISAQMATQPDLARMRTQLNAMETSRSKKEEALTGAKARIDMIDRKIAASRDAWMAVNRETFSGGTCPTCGQELPDKQRKAAKEAFEGGKAQRLRDIEQTASDLKASRAEVEERIAEYTVEIEDLNGQINAAREALEAAKEPVSKPQDMDGYADRKQAIEARIAALSGELADMIDKTSDVRGQLERSLAEINSGISEQMAILGRESVLAYTQKRVEELRADAQRAAEQLDEIEQVLYLIDEYSRYKTQFVEDSINEHFEIARFRLFREQANGGVEDRCDVVYDGVPYASLNNGAKINVGIDIINTLSAAFGVHVPLFVDNAESVTALMTCNSQTIRLVVSEKDKELRLNYED